MDSKHSAAFDNPVATGAGATGSQPPPYQPPIYPPVAVQQPMQVQPATQVPMQVQPAMQVPMQVQPAMQPNMQMQQVVHQGVVVQQPQTTSTTLVQMTGPQRPALRTWSSGLCSCFNDCLSCCLVAFFAPCYACYLATRMDEACCVGMPGCVPGGIMALRTKLRIQENIDGSICGDCCAAHWCMHCVICQLSREVDYVRNRNMQQGIQGMHAVIINSGH